jgi:hypothetical protein
LGEKSENICILPSKYKRIGFKSGTKTGCFRKHQFTQINQSNTVDNFAFGVISFSIEFFCGIFEFKRQPDKQNNQQFGVRSLWVVADISFLYFKHIDPCFSDSAPI